MNAENCVRALNHQVTKRFWWWVRGGRSSWMSGILMATRNTKRHEKMMMVTVNC